MSKKHLLVIDDEKAQRETLAGFLRKKGYAVRTAADGEQGLRQCVPDGKQCATRHHGIFGTLEHARDLILW